MNKVDSDIILSHDLVPVSSKSVSRRDTVSKLLTKRCFQYTSRSGYFDHFANVIEYSSRKGNPSYKISNLCSPGRVKILRAHGSVVYNKLITEHRQLVIYSGHTVVKDCFINFDLCELYLKLRMKTKLLLIDDPFNMNACPLCNDVDFVDNVPGFEDSNYVMRKNEKGHLRLYFRAHNVWHKWVLGALKYARITWPDYFWYVPDVCRYNCFHLKALKPHEAVNEKFISYWNQFVTDIYHNRQTRLQWIFPLTSLKGSLGSQQRNVIDLIFTHWNDSADILYDSILAMLDDPISNGDGIEILNEFRSNLLWKTALRAKDEYLFTAFNGVNNQTGVQVKSGLVPKDWKAEKICFHCGLVMFEGKIYAAANIKQSLVVKLNGYKDPYKQHKKYCSFLCNCGRKFHMPITSDFILHREQCQLIEK